MNKASISNEQFREKAKNWINHKIILSQKSDWYKVKNRRDAVFHIKNIFSSFLQFPSKYNLAQLALQLKKHEDILMIALPVPGNPSYETAFNSLTDLLNKANEIINEHNLQSLLNQH